MSFDLEPTEVLQHLHALGYCNISPEQLKEFIRDLKKLIRHDQRKAALRQAIHRETVEQCHRSLQTDNMPGLDSPGNVGRSSEVQQAVPDVSVDSELQQFSSRTCVLPHTRPATHNGHYGYDTESNDGSEDTGIYAKSKENTKKENIPPRPPSSFIRPASQKGRPKPKSDPVALYHYYQNIWSQNPQPGEDPRSRLRWTVRHQMLGHQYQPQTISRGASLEKLKNRPEWQS